MKDCTGCNIVFVKKEKSNGDFMLKKQCFKCGQSIGKTSYKFDDVGGIDKVKILPDFDQSLEDGYWRKKQEDRREELKIERENWRKDFFTQYNIYLNSSKWKLKRQKVLERDGYKCQACFTRKATEVHHKSYEFVYNEPLFDLVSVCKPCHEKIEFLKKQNKAI